MNINDNRNCRDTVSRTESEPAEWPKWVIFLFGLVSGVKACVPKK